MSTQYTFAIDFETLCEVYVMKRLLTGSGSVDYCHVVSRVQYPIMHQTQIAVHAIF